MRSVVCTLCAFCEVTASYMILPTSLHDVFCATVLQSVVSRREGHILCASWVCQIFAVIDGAYFCNECYTNGCSHNSQVGRLVCIGKTQSPDFTMNTCFKTLL